MVDGENTTSDERATHRVSDALTREPSTVRERIRQFELWVLVDLNRWVLVGALAGVVFLSIVLAVGVGPIGTRTYLLQGTALSKGYVELQTMTVTVITIVLAINQLVLSPALGSLETQRTRLDAILENRAALDDLTDGTTSPTEPTDYLQVLVETARERAVRLRDAAADSDDPEFRERVDQYVADVLAEADDVDRALEGEQFGTVSMLGAAMHFTTSDDIHAIRTIQREFGESLTDAERDALDAMLEVLKLATTAREYFRALYVQWEFINFSRALLVTGLPALVVAHMAVGTLDASVFGGTTLGVLDRLWYESSVFTVTVVPVLVVISYVARLSAVAKATIFISPFAPGQWGSH